MPETLRLRANQPEDVARCAAILQRGGLVAFPTETVYGLGANALSADAVQGIFAAKGRPSWDPLIVHLASVSQLGDVARAEGKLADRVDRLAKRFWPGPLTLLLPRREAIPDEVTAGRAAVGVRLPSHPAAQALLRATKLPLAAPSANFFSHISPTTAAHVLDDLDGRIDAVLDGGPCAVGVESTVLDPALTPMRIYRAGALTVQMLSEAVGVPVELYTVPASVSASEQASREALPSPGVGLRHYAPRVVLRLCGWHLDELREAVARALGEVDGSVGVMLPGGWAKPPKRARTVLCYWGRGGDEASLAADLFAGLRALETQVERIVCPLPEPGGLRDALRDRLVKAAKPR